MIPSVTTVLVDRDGVLCVDTRQYIKSVEELILLPRSLEALHRLTLADLPVAIISNQSGVGRGFLSQQTLKEVTEALLAAIREAGGEIAGVYYCPHTPEDDCPCRKPKPGLVQRAVSELGFDPTRAVMVGDHLCDVQLANAIGARSILVLTGQGAEQLEAAQATPPDAVADDLLAAVPLILSWKGA